MAFTNDGAHLVVWRRPTIRSISVHDAATLDRMGDPIALPEFRGPAQFALTPDGRAVITASDAGELTWWDLLTGQPTRTLDIAPGPQALALSPDGRTVAVGIDESVQLVDVGTGEVTTATAGLPARPNWLRFSPDGRTLVSANVDGTVTLFDVASATPRDTLRGHADAVRAARLQPRRHHALHGQQRRERHRLGPHRDPQHPAIVLVHDASVTAKAASRAGSAPTAG